jgi:gas vesicle protein
MQLSDLKNLSKEDILNTIGLESQSSHFVSSTALFGIGVLVGAGIGLLFAPRSGQELRSDLMGRVDDLKKYATDKSAPSSSAHSGINTTNDLSHT